jgi:hypothetical protein
MDQAIRVIAVDQLTVGCPCRGPVTIAVSVIVIGTVAVAVAPVIPGLVGAREHAGVPIVAVIAPIEVRHMAIAVSIGPNRCSAIPWKHGLVLIRTVGTPKFRRIVSVSVAVKVTEPVAVGIYTVVARILNGVRCGTAIAVVAIVATIDQRDVSIAVRIVIVVATTVRIDAIVPSLNRVGVGCSGGIVAVTDPVQAYGTRKTP